VDTLSAAHPTYQRPRGAFAFIGKKSSQWKRHFLVYSTFHHDGKISPVWCEWGGARPHPFTLFTITYKVEVYAPAERADELPLFLLSLYSTPISTL
jgi:hypothetical protein